MTKIQIETITPVHIGSGQKLYENLDYLYDEKAQKIYIIDPQKVYHYIGENNIDRWVDAIEDSTNIVNLIKGISGSISPKEIASREIPVVGKLYQKEIKSNIRNGMGKPYIPGSSLKGALRTLIVRKSIAGKDTHVLKKLDECFESDKPKDAPLLDYLFNKTQNNLMKFLRIYDAHFENTQIYSVQIANKHGSEWKYQIKGRPNVMQPIECISPKQSYLVDLQTPNEITAYKYLKNNELLLKGNYPDNVNVFSKIENTETFLQIMHDQTIKICKKDYEQLDKNRDSTIEKYLDKLNDLIHKMNNKKPNEFYIRVGFGLGYIGMTGGWLDFSFIENKSDKIKKIDPRAHYKDIYPKTRRYLSDGTPLGFVKFTLF